LIACFILPAANVEALWCMRGSHACFPLTLAFIGQQCVQSRTYDNILSTYTGVPLSNGASLNPAEARANATALFNAGQPSYLGFTTAQINGIWASPIGIWRVISFIFDNVRSPPLRRRLIH
jgi:hypothetical protein